MRHSLDLAHIKDAQIGLPAMKLEKRVIAAEVLRQCGRTRDDLIKHSADCSTIDDAWLHGEADDAASELIHDDHHPVGFKDQRFTSKEIDAPEAVLGVSEESQPGRTVGAAGRPTVFRENTSHTILVDLDTKQESDLLSNAAAAEARVPTFHLNDRSDQLWVRTLRAGLPSALRREEPA